MKHIIEDFMPRGGMHCVTNSLKQTFEYNGWPLSEAVLFGLGGGVGFTYIQLADAPMISGRGKVFEFEQQLANRLGVQFKCKASKEADKAFIKAKALIENNVPVMIYADMSYLKYMNLEPDSHFGGHSIVLFGFDEEKEVFYVSDRDASDFWIRTPKGEIHEDFHIVGFEEMKAARSSKYRPFPPRNRWIEFDFKDIQPINKRMIHEAVRETANHMLNAPAKLLGINGIHKFAKEVLKWDRFTEDKLRRSGITNYFMIHKDGGTGGGLFRKMYGQFLKEACEKYKVQSLEGYGERFGQLSEAWDAIGERMMQLYETSDAALLKEISERANKIAQDERDIFDKLYEVCR